MVKLLSAIFLCLLLLNASAQRQTFFSVALTNNSPAMPFSKFGGLFKKPFHPGIDIGYGFNWKTKQHHDWFQTIHLGYFFHRFVQHGVPLYSTFGYRYKFSPHISSDVALGGGYLHSIPAVAKFKLNENGEYERNNGVGRMQAIAMFNLGAAYTLNPGAAKPKTIFTTYQQRLQMPFIKSYVPLLPYNSIMIGVRSNIK